MSNKSPEVNASNIENLQHQVDLLWKSVNTKQEKLRPTIYLSVLLFIAVHIGTSIWTVATIRADVNNVISSYHYQTAIFDNQIKNLIQRVARLEGKDGR